MIYNDPIQIDEQLGVFPKHSAKADNTIKDRLKYIGGIVAIDDLVQSRQYNKKVGSVYLTMRPKGLEILLREGFKKYPFAIESENIISWSIESILDITILEKDSILGQFYSNNNIKGNIQKNISHLIGESDAPHDINHDDILSVCFNNEYDESQVLILGLERAHIGDVQHYMNYNFNEKLKEA